MSESKKREKDVARLPHDIDEYISNLKPSQYKDGWPEDKWQEEMEKHPFFMQNPLNPDEELPPLVEGLQQLKYDDTINSPDEIAQTYKHEGNLNYQNKLYKRAIINYLEGLKLQCSDSIKAQLHNNCAAAHMAVHNYRACVINCEHAVRLNPEYKKPELRAAHCYFQLAKYNECIQKCDKILVYDSDNPSIIELRKKAVKEKITADLNERKHAKQLKTLKEMTNKLMVAIRERGINIGPHGPLKHLGQLKPNYEGPHSPWVYLDDDVLIWPVTFVFPEYRVLEVIRQFPEVHTFRYELEEMFFTTPEWDKADKYRVETVNLYFMGKNNNPVKVDLDDSLETVITNNQFIVYSGTPAFFCFHTGSRDEVQFLLRPMFPGDVHLEPENWENVDVMEYVTIQMFNKKRRL